MLVEWPQYRIGGNFVNYGLVLLMKPLSSKLKYILHTFIHMTGKYDFVRTKLIYSQKYVHLCDLGYVMKSI